MNLGKYLFWINTTRTDKFPTKKVKSEPEKNVFKSVANKINSLSNAVKSKEKPSKSLGKNNKSIPKAKDVTNKIAKSIQGIFGKK